MKKIIIFASVALPAVLFNACTRENISVAAGEAARVTFSVQDDFTRTALIQEDETIVFSWDSTANGYVHLYENEVEGAEPAINVEGRFATLSATFSGGEAPYAYNALVAANVAGRLPSVPAVQKPAPASFDPGADILVGKTTEGVSERPESVHMYFVRAAVVGRVRLVDIPDGEVVKSVIIISSGKKLAGSATEVNFTEGTCTYGAAAGDSESITLNFEEDNTVSGDFDACFTACPVDGGLTAVTVKVVTDKYVRTKTITASDDPIVFGLEKFVQLSLDMDGENVEKKDLSVISNVSSIENNGRYVIVDAGYSKLVKNGASSTIGIGSLTDYFTLSSDKKTLSIKENKDISSVVWTAVTNLAGLGDSYCSFENDGWYLYGVASGAVPVLSKTAPTATQSVSGIVSGREASPYFTYTLNNGYLNYASPAGYTRCFFYQNNTQWGSSSTATAGKTYLYKLGYADPVAVTGVTVSGSSSVKVGKTLQLSAAVVPSDASIKSVIWSVVDGAENASVDASGLVTGKAAGSVTVRATSVDNPTIHGDFTITVNPLVMVTYELISATSYTDYAQYTTDSKYLIVSENKKQVMWCDNGSAASFGVTCTDDAIQFEEDDAAKYEWTSSARSVDEYPGWKLSNNGYYVYRESSSMKFGTSSGSTKYYNWSYDGSHLHNHKSTGDNQYNYIQYSNNAWTMSNTITTTYLFKRVAN